MATSLKAITLALGAGARVFASTPRSTPHLGLLSTALTTHYQQRCPVSSSQHFFSLEPPKRPAGAFLKFMNQKSQEIISRNPDASQTERCRLAGRLWHNLDSEEKNRFKLDAREELQVYRQKYFAFLDQLNKQEKAQLLMEKREKRMLRAFRKQKLELQKLGRPKKPPNSFNLFVKASRKQQGRAEPPDFLKGLVQSWRQMSEKEKEIYKVNASLEREKYLLEMTRWEQKMRELGRQDLIRKKSQMDLISSSSKTMSDKKSKTGAEKSSTQRKK